MEVGVDCSRRSVGVTEGRVGVLCATVVLAVAWEPTTNHQKSGQCKTQSNNLCMHYLNSDLRWADAW
jgi:hypothetical protein